MKRFPVDTIALMSGALLYVFLQVYGVAASFALVLLIQLFEVAPRVAIFGMLLVALAPVPVIASIHHGADKTMKKGEGILPSADAWWAGTLGWLVIVGSTIVTTIVLLVIDPPERDGLASLAHLAALAAAAPAKSILYGAVWISAASLLYGVERAARDAD